MAQDTADILVETLEKWGVDTVFGLPGDGINGVIEAFRTRMNKIRFIQVRHEESAAFMACAYAKYTGKLGVCLATSGPGAIHLLNGLYDAKMDHAPVLAITGMTYHDLVGQEYQQDVDTKRLFEDVTVYNQQVTGPEDVRAITDLACRHAFSKRGVSQVTLPVDLQVTPCPGHRSERAIPKHTSEVFAEPIQVASDADIRRAAKILNEAKRSVILCGQGASDAAEILLEVAETLGAPIVKTLLGKAVVPDLHPLCMGGIGFLGTKPSEDAMDECDAFLMVGTSFPYMNYLPKHEQAIGIQIEINCSRIGLRYPIEVGLVGDSRLTLEKLRPLLERKQDRKFLEKLQGEMSAWRSLMHERATRKDVPLKPQVIARELSNLISDDAIISTDSGTITTWAARHIDIRAGQKFSCSGNLATMAPALPYTIAAQAAYPDRQCIAFIGDGGFSMLMADFATAVKYDLPIKVIIIKNNVLGQIKWEQIVFLGNPEYVVELQPIDFVKFAEACGGVGFHVEKYDEVSDAIASALASKKPAIVEAVVDPYEPPMPPKITLDEAYKFGKALVRGEPNRGRIALTLFRDRVEELV